MRFGFKVEAVVAPPPFERKVFYFAKPRKFADLARGLEAFVVGYLFDETKCLDDL